MPVAVRHQLQHSVHRGHRSLPPRANTRRHATVALLARCASTRRSARTARAPHLCGVRQLCASRQHVTAQPEVGFGGQQQVSDALHVDLNVLAPHLHVNLATVHSHRGHSSRCSGDGAIQRARGHTSLPRLSRINSGQRRLRRVPPRLPVVGTGLPSCAVPDLLMCRAARGGPCVEGSADPSCVCTDITPGITHHAVLVRWAGSSRSELTLCMSSRSLSGHTR